jgi:transcriptional regulator with XRE-family HTH domain
VLSSDNSVYLSFFIWRKEMIMENMNLRIERTKKKMCQYELSHKTGISQGRISLFERGYRQPTKEQAEMIAGALQIDVKEIFK